ncbi:MAG: site-specific DNA-methyltransferase [Actinobacteria bacterium]|nr:site-specific DNA-methyltransferase [Actinomycetota bacterium]
MSSRIYNLGRHRLACGDCRDGKLVKELIGTAKIKLIIADPPYGVSYVEGKTGFVKIKKNIPIVNDNLISEESYREFTKGWLGAAVPYMAAKNSCYIFNSDKMIFALRDGMKDCNFRLAQILIWIKNNQVMGRRDYLARHELIAYGWHGTHQFYKSKDTSVLFYPKPNASPLHPTTKPLGLIRRLILNSTKIGDIVFDPFIGSGTTLIACEQTGRKCIAIEIDSGYCNTIIARFNKLTGSKNL